MIYRRKIKSRLLWQSVILTVAIGCLLVGSASATSWIGAVGDWFDANNWDDGVPDRWELAEIDKVDDDGEVGVAVISSGSARASFVMMGNHAFGKVRQTGGSLTLYGDEFNVGWLDVGESPVFSRTKYSSYLLSGGSISAEAEFIGVAGTGVFEQTGGTNNMNDELFVGYAPDPGYYGIYKLQAGGLSASLEVIGGYSGSGSFWQSGGTNSAGIVYVGWSPGASGSYTLSGTGQLQAGMEIIGGYFYGYGGHGSFNQSGGANIVTGNLYLGKGLVSYGTYSLSGGTLQSGAVHIADGGTGVFYLGGGVLDTSFIYVNTGGTISVFQDWSYDGTMNVNGGCVYISSHCLTLDDLGAEASVTMTNGTVYADEQCIGANGHAIFTQTGGTNTVIKDLRLGHNSGASGTYNLNETSELRVGGTVHISRTDGPGVGPPYPYGELLMNDGVVLGTTADASMIAHGSHANIIGQGTFDIKVAYESDPNYCGNQSVDVTLDRNHLLVGGTYSVDQITPVDFAGGTLTNLLESSVFNVSFDGTFSDDFEIAIPYSEAEVASLGFSESALLVFRETGPDTYEQLGIIEVGSARNRITARSKFFGKFAVAICTIETIDPNPDLMSDGKVIADQEQLGSDMGRLVSGVIADGITPVVIRAQVAGAGTVEFAIKDENSVQSDVGFLSSAGGSEQVTTLTVDVDELADGRYMAFAVLTAPSAFFRGPGDESLEERPITIEATFTPSGGGDAVIDDREIQLVRPPVIMVHGLWSNARAFSTLNTELSNNGFVFLYRLSYNNSGPFAENDWVLPHSIRNVLDSVRNGGYACTKVDVVSHSMGGLLAKRISAGFAQRNVRKIITIGSLYLGSPLADWLYGSLSSEPVKAARLEWLLNKTMHTTNAITGGAIEDLRTIGNPNIPVPTQIAGVDCQNIIVGLRDGTTPRPLQAFVAILKLTTGQWTAEGAHDVIFGPNEESDWVVSESSQQGGEPNLLSSLVAWHCTETEDSDVLSRVLQVLNLPAQTGESAPGNSSSGGQLLMSAQGPCFAGETVYLSSSEPTNGTVEIVEPNEDHTCTAGQSITVFVQGTGDTTNAAVFAFFGSSSFGDIVELPWQDNINVPEDCVGSQAKIIAYGLDPNMNITDLNEVNLVLDSNIVLQDIIFGFGDVWTFDFKTYPEQSHEFQLYPVGVFSDGSEHPLSVLSEEKAYQSYNETVASVDPNGLLIVHSRGTAVVTVTCSSKTASLIIEVDTYLGDLNLNGTVDYSDITTLAAQWLQTPSVPTVDISPEGGDGIVNFLDFAVLANHWLEGTIP